MGDYGERYADAQWDGCQKGRGNDDTVYQVVKAITNQNKRYGGGLLRWLLLVTVTPEYQFFEHKKENDSAQQGY